VFGGAFGAVCAAHVSPGWISAAHRLATVASPSPKSFVSLQATTEEFSLPVTFHKVRPHHDGFSFPFQCFLVDNTRKLNFPLVSHRDIDIRAPSVISRSAVTVFDGPLMGI
jgi:hypothetical protein